MSDRSAQRDHLPHVAIVGGGITGLATAFTLRELASQEQVNLTCSVFETDPSWGGKILTHRTDNFIIEAGPDSFLSQKPWALELCAKLGLSDRIINTNDGSKKTFVFSRGRLRELPEGLVMIVPTKIGSLLQSGLLSWPGLARMGLELLLPARRSRHDESLAAFFRRRVGREAFERLVEPLMAGIYAGDAEQMSIRATFPRFLELEQQYGSLIRGILAGRRRSPGGERGASRPSRTMFVTLQDGLNEMTERLVSRLHETGTTLVAGRRVTALRVRSSRLASWTYDLLFEGGPSVSADAVVLATPAFVSAELIRPLTPLAAGLLETIPYSSTATVSLAFRASALDRPLTGFGFVVPRIENRDVIAVTWTSSKWSHRAPASHGLIRCYVGGAGREHLLDLDDRELLIKIRADLRSMMGLTAEPEYVEVNRWIRGMPQYTLGHLDRLTAIADSLSRYNGLFLAGAAYRGVGIPDCIRDANEVAAAVVRQLTAAGVSPVAVP